MVGSTVSHYKVFSEVGQGVMGVVYKAEDNSASTRARQICQLHGQLYWTSYLRNLLIQKPVGSILVFGGPVAIHTVVRRQTIKEDLKHV